MNFTALLSVLAFMLGSFALMAYAVKSHYRYKLQLKSGPSKYNRLLREILNAVVIQTSLDDAGKYIVNRLRQMELFHVDYYSLFAYDYEKDEIKPIFTEIKGKGSNEFIAHCEKRFRQTVLDKRNSNGNGEVEYSDKTLDYPTAEEREIKYFNIIPLESGNQPIGAIVIESEDCKDLVKNNELDNEIYKVTMNYVSVTVHNLLMYHKIQYIAWHDPLTDLYNKAYMNKDLTEKLEQASRNNSSLYIVVYDIDHFKKFNDTHGHLVGDMVLKGVSHCIRDNLRLGDEIYRFGGEEFVLCVNKREGEDIFLYIDMLRQKVDENIIYKEDNTPMHVTISMGVAQYPSAAATTKDLFKCADTAVYKAKNAGRNKVIIYNKEI